MKENMKEIWEDIPNYEGLYQVSSFGRVRSLPKEWVSGKGTVRKHNGKILNGYNDRGYLSVVLSKEGKVKMFYVHQLVSMAFLEHIPDGYNVVCDHIDNNPSNNRVDNLQLISQRENSSKDTRGSSKYCGVHWSKQHSKWRSQIQINGQRIYLGLFDDEERAGRTYQLALSNIDKYNGNVKEFREYINSLPSIIIR